MSTSTADILRIVEDALRVREELHARGVPAGDTAVMVGCALGVMLAGGGR